MITLLRQGWAQDNPAFRQILTSRLLPDATREEMASFNDLQRSLVFGGERRPDAAIAGGRRRARPLARNRHADARAALSR